MTDSSETLKFMVRNKQRHVTRTIPKPFIFCTTSSADILAKQWIPSSFPTPYSIVNYYENERKLNQE